MILISRTKKKIIALEGFWFKNYQTRDYKMKKILIVNQDIIITELYELAYNELKKKNKKFKSSIC